MKERERETDREKKKDPNVCESQTKEQEHYDRIGSEEEETRSNVDTINTTRTYIILTTLFLPTVVAITGYYVSMNHRPSNKPNQRKTRQQ